MQISNARKHREARALARDRLIKAGYSAGQVRTARGLLYAIEREIGADRNCSPEEWIDRYIELTRPNIVPPRQPIKRPGSEYAPSEQWQINVERARQAQPKRWTPGGIGNGAERQHGFGRGM